MFCGRDQTLGGFLVCVGLKKSVIESVKANEQLMSLVSGVSGQVLGEQDEKFDH